MGGSSSSSAVYRTNVSATCARTAAALGPRTHSPGSRAGEYEPAIEQQDKNTHDEAVDGDLRGKRR